MAEMRYWISAMHVGEKIGDGRIEAATSLQSMVENAQPDRRL